MAKVVFVVVVVVAIAPEMGSETKMVWLRNSSTARMKWQKTHMCRTAEQKSNTRSWYDNVKLSVCECLSLCSGYSRDYSMKIISIIYVVDNGVCVCPPIRINTPHTLWVLFAITIMRACERISIVCNIFNLRVLLLFGCSSVTASENELNLQQQLLTVTLSHFIASIQPTEY